MTATPAWPPHSLPRLFVKTPLAADLRLELDGPQANYLGAVLRLREGAELKLFDDRTGEWLAAIEEAGKRRVTLRVLRRLRERETVPDLWLLFAPIKRGRLDWIIEKATELGVARILPVRTDRTIVDRINPDRLRAHAIEAAEQCERTALPELADLQTLEHALAALTPMRALLFADEAGGTPFAEAATPGPAAILIGPEGGFTDRERTRILAHPGVRRTTLGPRILRADTAALAAVSLWMAAAGDWGRAPKR
jgi:16S rRNA (uracil1498-N3)-methyltransferase